MPFREHTIPMKILNFSQYYATVRAICVEEQLAIQVKDNICDSFHREMINIPS